MYSERIKKLGAAVRNARKKQGLTQLQLAATSGVGVRFIRELEHGKESCYWKSIKRSIHVGYRTVY